jgi:hypothetical protein
MSTIFDVRRWATQAGIQTTGGFAVIAECVTMDELQRFAEIAIARAGFSAADMATAAAQGFRDGVSSVSAGSETVASYAIRLLVASALITQAKADEALRLAAEITAAPGPDDGESNE